MRIETASAEFVKQGFVILENIVSSVALDEVTARCETELKDVVGSRNLLRKTWVREFGEYLQTRPGLEKLIGEGRIPVQCTYFSKTRNRNWLVPMHRDSVIPVNNRIDSDDWSDWSTKEGEIYARPPEEILNQLVAVRVHLEDNSLINGALRVMPGSHRANNNDADQVLCEVRRTGAVVMSPQILHASSKIEIGRRRVLHFLFGPHSLPNGAEWAIFKKSGP